MFRTYSAALMMVVTISVVPAKAAEPVSNSTAVAANAAAEKMADDTDWSLPAVQLGASGASTSRGALLPSLYVSLAGLNAFDAFSTKAGLAHGAVEGNGAMKGVAQNSAALWAVKGLATASSVMVAEHLWKTHHKGQAIAVMVISNGMMAAVAAHNTSVLNSVR